MKALPQTLELSAAVLLVVGGAVACFAGYRLFRMVIAIYGFVLGAMIAIATMAPTSWLAMIVTGVLGGAAGTLILAVVYFLGIALVGAGLGAVLAHAGWSYVRGGDPPTSAVIVLTLSGAIGAMVLQKYMTVLSTAFIGGWTMIVGGLAIASARGPGSSLSASGLWIPYPLVPAPARPWVPAAWLALGLIGTTVQVFLTARKKKK